MITREDIQQLVNEIAMRYEPEKIILFGSFAYGTPQEDSDIDLLVIKSFSGNPIDEAIAIRYSTDSRFPLDLIVRTPQMVARRVQLGDFFMSDIVTKGKVLYERP